MANWQPPSWQNDAARRAQQVNQQVQAQMSESARRNAELANRRYRQRGLRPRRRNPVVSFVKFVFIIAILAVGAYIGYLILRASGHLPKWL